MSRICIIAAIAKDNALGFENKLLYWLPNDLKRFKALTTGQTIIMGRRTFESLPKGALPNRRNIVLTRQDIEFQGAERYGSLEEALGRIHHRRSQCLSAGPTSGRYAMPDTHRGYSGTSRCLLPRNKSIRMGNNQRRGSFSG